MDDFLTKMYEEEMEKTSAAELDNFMDSLPVDELEALLEIEGGIEKVAVGGPVEPPMPDSLPGNELDSQMKAVDEYATKSRTETPPTRKQTAEPTAVSHQGPGKQVSKEAMTLADTVGRIFAKHAAGDGGDGDEGEMETTASVKAKIAARALRVVSGAPPHIKTAAAKVAALQITAACKKTSQMEGEMGGEMEKEDAFTTPEAKAKSRMMAKAMKLGKGKPAAARKGLVSAMGKKL